MIELILEPEEQEVVLSALNDQGEEELARQLRAESLPWSVDSVELKAIADALRDNGYPELAKVIES